MKKTIKVAGIDYTKEEFEDLKRLVIDELENIPFTGRLSMLSTETQRTFTKDDLIREVEKETEFGMQIIEWFIKERLKMKRKE